MTSKPRQRQLEVENIGDIAVVNFVDKRILSEQNIHLIGEELFRLVDELGRTKLLLNFSAVEIMTSAALSKLILLDDKLKLLPGSKLVLCGISPNIREMFVITGLERRFTIHKEEQAALQAF